LTVRRYDDAGAREEVKTTRREFVSTLAAGAVLPLLPSRAAHARSRRFRDDPFTLGVASGYPTQDSCVLWTRLAPGPAEPGGGVHDDVVPVDWEVAADERLERVVQRGTTYATRDWAHSVHVEPVGLEPGRPYWYRFTAGRVRSPIGRTATAPARGAPASRARIAVAACQQYEHGYYTAYRRMVEDEPDLILHVGDYIYERSWGIGPFVRAHGAPECYTLDDYRARYALYKGDLDLRAAHAVCPWLVTWDDHEVDNDYADVTSEENDEPRLLLARRAAAYQAYYEHMPLPRRAVPYGPDMRLHAERNYGDLVNLLMLDDRQYRSVQACPAPGKRGANRVVDCAELASPERTKLGARQEEWLAARLVESKARWNLLAQGTVMAYVDEQPGPGERFWTDGWNGYPAARERLIDALATPGVRNPLVLSGDIHAFAAADINRVPADSSSPVVASELTTTSISSQSLPQAQLDQRRADSPSVLWLNGESRGYLRLDITPERLQADMVGLDSVAQPDSATRVTASFVIEDERPGLGLK
jgi:alkaline phosphatase D